MLPFCHSVYLCKTGAKTLPFQHFCILYKAFLHPLQSMFASFTKHVCKPKHHHLKIVNTPFTKRKHGCYDTQTWLLRYANMAVTKHGVTLTDFTLHFSLTFTKLLYYKFIPLLNNFTMQEKCYWNALHRRFCLQSYSILFVSANYSQENVCFKFIQTLFMLFCYSSRASVLESSFQYSYADVYCCKNQ